MWNIKQKKQPKPKTVKTLHYNCAYATVMPVLIIFPVILQTVIDQSQNAVYWRMGKRESVSWIRGGWNCKTWQVIPSSKGGMADIARLLSLCEFWLTGSFDATSNHSVAR